MDLSFKPVLLYLMASGYTLAGIYHFVNPRLYIPMIPPYLPFPRVLNYLAGAVEILLGVGLFYEPTRSWAALGVVLLLLVFLPVHIYMVQVGGDLPGGITLPKWAAWVRLVIVHPLLIAAAAWFI